MNFQIFHTGYFSLRKKITRLGLFSLLLHFHCAYKEIYQHGILKKGEES